MLDGYKSGMSTVRESCKSTELKRRIATEMRRNKYEKISLRINSTAQFLKEVQR